MAAETNNGFFHGNALGRTESTNHHRTTAAFTRSSHDVYGLNTPGLVSQRPPGISGRADMTAQMYIDARRTAAVAPMERATRRRHMEAVINGGLHGLDNSGPVSQNIDLNNPTHRSADLQPEAFTLEPYREFFGGGSDQLLRQIEASDENQPPGRTDTDDFHNEETRLNNLMDEINKTTSGLSRNRAETFLKSVPMVLAVDLPDDNRDCPICMEEYVTPEHYEPPVRLPCDHVIGKDCLRSWLKSSVLNLNNNTCPMCRTVLYNRDILADHLRDIDGMTDHIPEDTRSRQRIDHARLLEEATNPLGSYGEQREEWGAPPHWRDMTTGAYEQLRELDRSATALREEFARLQETSRTRVEELYPFPPPSDPAASLEVAIRARREQGSQIHAEAMEALARQPRRMMARSDRDLDVEIALRREYGRPIRERRGAM